MNTIVGLSRKPSSTFARRFCPFGSCEGAEAHFEAYRSKISLPAGDQPLRGRKLTRSGVQTNKLGGAS
jgi:hypothetical protein